MGRFYETSQPHFIDNKMYEAPAELMSNVLMNKEKAVDDTISSAVSFLDKLKAEALTQDTPRLQEKIKAYEQNISGIVSNIQANPMEYSKYQGDITKLGRDIGADWSTGEIGTMQKYRKQVAEEYDVIDKLSEKDGYDAAYKAARKKEILAKYTGIGWNNNTGTAGQSPSITGDYKGLVFDEGFAQHMKDSGYDVTKETNGGNGYTYTKQGSYQGVSKERVAQAYVDYIQANPNLQAAVNERRNLGIAGFENADLSQLYEFNTDKDGKKQFKGFRNDYYGNKINAGISTYARGVTKDSNTIGNDAGYFKNKDYQREDAAAAKLIPEHINTTYGHVYQVASNSADNFQKALGLVNQGLTNSQNALQSQIKQLKVKPGSETEKLIKQGNVQAMVAAGLSEDSAYKLSSDYKSQLTKKNFLSAQAQGFKDYLKNSTLKNLDTSKPGWLNNPLIKNVYNKFLGETKNKNNVMDNVVSFNETGMSTATIKEIQGAAGQFFDDAYFNIDQTVKGSTLEFDDAKGNTIVYVPQNDKRAGTSLIVNSVTGAKKTKWFDGESDSDGVKSSKRVIYKTAPGGRLSFGLLEKEGLMTSGVDANGNKKYTTRKNGKEAGFVIDEKTIGLDMSLANDGDSNLVMHVQMGNSRLPVLMSTNQLNVPTLNTFLNTNMSERAFNRDMSHTNISTLAKRVKDVGNGESFMTDKGRAFIVHADGSRVEYKTEKEIKRIHQIVYSAEE